MLLTAYGTRPEYIKLKPLFEKIECRKLFTGQHEDIVDNDGTALEIDIVDGNNRLDGIVQSILNADFIFEGIDQVMVQGDTTSAFAVALAAFHRGIPVIHLEAGLRTFDISCPYPEEFNRTAIDKMSSLLFCATENNKRNLIAEGIKEQNIFVTGNTGLDNLVDINTEYGDTVFCTMHRRENLSSLKTWFTAISTLASKYTELDFVFPLHPNPEIVRAAHKYFSDSVIVLPPQSREKSLEFLSTCRFVITDSGGVQEEASFFKKAAYICRRNTERIECIGNTSILCRTPDELINAFNQFFDDYIFNDKCPYGDGFAADRIVKVLKGVKYG